MVTRYRVRREGGNYLGVSAEFNSSTDANPIPGTEKILCQTNTFTIVGGKPYTVGPRSATDSSGCVYIKKEPGNNGQPFDLIPVWFESNGWTP